MAAAEDNNAGRSVKAEPAGGKPIPEVKIGDLVKLLANMNRLIVLVSQLPALKDAKLGIADWLIFSSLTEDTPLLTAQLAKQLGISQQRVVQTFESLEQAGLLVIDEEDGRRRAALTADGKSRIDAVNAEILPLLVVALKDREHILGQAAKHSGFLLRMGDAE
jgi:DNA-binding MarR family transcriptional regulator